MTPKERKKVVSALISAAHALSGSLPQPRKRSTSNPLTMRDTLRDGDNRYTVMDLVAKAKAKGRAVATKYGTKKREGTYSANDIEYFYLVVDLAEGESIIGVPKGAWDKAKVKDITPKEDEEELTNFLVKKLMHKKMPNFNQKAEFNVWAQGKTPQQKLEYLRKYRG